MLIRRPVLCLLAGGLSISTVATVGGGAHASETGLAEPGARVAATAVPMADVTTTARSYRVLGGRRGDITPPQLSISGPGTGTTVGERFQVTGAAQDDTRLRRITVRLAGLPLVTAQRGATWSADLTAAGLADGPQSLVVTATDVAGNRRTITRRLVLDHSFVAPVPAPAVRTAAPPSPEGYFSLQPVGRVAALPSSAECAARIRRSTWEPRPWNTKRNSVVPDRAAVAKSLASHKRSTFGTYDTRWDSLLLARVDGAMTGTTDEILQWAACKWGLPDNLIRAIAHHESTWNQYLTYQASPGRPVTYYGSGDFPAAGGSDPTYSSTITRLGGFDYTRFYGSGISPRTFSIVGVMSYDGWRPDWPDQTNGTFPFNRDSTAFAVDYLGAELRGCYEGWKFWLRDTGNGSYAAGDLWGCVGSWFAGSWHAPAGDAYAAGVRAEAEQERPWLAASYPSNRPECHPTWGCPGPDPLP